MPIELLDSPNPSVVIAKLDHGKANALDFELVEALAAAIERLGDEQALVLTGRPGMFTGGLDTSILEADDSTARSLLDAMGRLLVQCLLAKRPIVVGADGHGIAAGAMLMLVADHTYISDRPAKYGFAEVPNGLALPPGVVELIAARANPRATLLLAAHGHLAGPAEAVELGLAHECVASDQLMALAVERAGDLANLPATAYLTTKRLVNAPLAARMNAADSSVSNPDPAPPEDPPQPT